MNESFKKKVATVVLTSFCLASFMPNMAIASEEAATTKPLTGLTTEEITTLSSKQRLLDQEKIEQDILADFSKGTYTLTNPMVKLNPFGTAPLSALALFNTPEETKIEVTIEGKTENTTIKHAFTTYSTHHEIPIYGLYMNYSNHITLTATNKAGQKTTKGFIIETPDLPKVDSIKIQVLAKDETEMSDGLTFCSSVANREIPIIGIDANGEIRSIITGVGNGTTPIRRLENGRLLFFSDKAQRPYYYAAGFVETDLLGKIYTEYLRNGCHHEVRKLPNGNYLVDSEKAGTDVTEDFIVEIDGQTGQKLRQWDMKEIIKLKEYLPDVQYRGDGEEYSGEDWLHINSFWPVPGEDAIIISGRHQDAMIKINLTKSEVEWIISEPSSNFTPELNAKRLTPIGENFEYTWGQHAISLLPDNRIFVFNNGNARSKDPAKALSNDESYSNACIYQIDEKNRTVELLWQYGKERGNELYSSFICDVDYLGPNHYLINFGGINHNEPEARIIELKDQVVVNEIKVNDNMYRAERMTLYDFDKEYQLTKQPGRQLGQLVSAE